tara:strand:+ start:370 stop:978 length:609 start_codon:yes stop_codon:yes gene_type:complete
MKEKFLVGLGNPGKDYKYSRHNIGFLILENFTKKYNSQFKLKTKLRSWCSEFKINDLTYKLFLPNTFMNNSGEAVKAIVDWYKIDLDQLFIIVDDLDIPLGKIRFRKQGSSGGHNGLKSIIKSLQTQNFNRIRVGIGSPEMTQKSGGYNTVSHVLGNISSEEKKILDKVFLRIHKSLEELHSKTEDNIMSELNSFNHLKFDS